MKRTLYRSGLITVGVFPLPTDFTSLKGNAISFKNHKCIINLRFQLLVPGEGPDVVDDADHEAVVLAADAGQEAVVHHVVAGQERGVPLDGLVERVLVSAV